MVTKRPALRHATTIDPQTGDKITIIDGCLRITVEKTIAWDLDAEKEIEIPAGTGVVLGAAGNIPPIGLCSHGKLADNSAKIAYRL